MDRPAYVLERTPRGVVLTAPGRRTLRPVPVHSPTGFEYGYLGSGPAETAYVILRDYISRATGVPPGRIDVPPEVYQAFKEDMIAILDQDIPRHEIAVDSIARWLRERGVSLGDIAIAEADGVEDDL